MKFGKNVNQLWSTGRDVSFASLATASKLDELWNKGAQVERKPLDSKAGIKEALEEANKQTLETAPLLRWKAYKERYNKRIEQGLQIEVSNIDSKGTTITLSKEEQAKLKLKEPSFMQRARLFTQEAKANGKVTELALEVSL